MTDKSLRAVLDCLESQAHYASMSACHALNGGIGIRARAYDAMAEAYLMRSETLTKLDGEK